MTVQRPIARTRRKTSKKRSASKLTTALVVTACVAAAAATYVGVRSQTTLPDLPSSLIVTPDAVRAASDHEAVMRAVYQHSVVPGGVYNAMELRDAIMKDSVVAAHYAGVSLLDARVERVKAPRQVYVSYRIGDQIYWTKRKVSLNVGEAIITDGNTEIRARCGNCISALPMSPTLDAEPPIEELDRAVTLPGEPPLAAAADPAAPVEAAPALAAVDLPIAQANSSNDDAPLAFAAPFGAPLAMALTESNRTRSNEETTGDPGDPGDPADPDDPKPDPVPPSDDPPSDEPDPDPPYYPPTPPVDPPGDKPVSVPEPGSLLLVGTGLAAYALRRRKAR